MELKCIKTDVKSIEKCDAEQIKKALECCRYGGRCAECPCFEIPNCQALANENALALITSQEQRIAELEIELKAMRGAANAYKMHIVELTEENERLKATKYMAYSDGRIEMLPTIEQVKSDTVRKMQERLIAEFRKDGRMNYYIRMTLDQIVKEMLEGN